MRGRSRTTTALAAGLLALVALAGASGAATSDPTITKAAKATRDDLEPTRTYTSPYVLVDPSDPLTVVAGTVEMRTRACHVLRSVDGGVSWKRLDAAPVAPSYPYCFHTRGASTMTPMAWGRDGTLYMARTGWDTQDTSAPGRFPGTWGNMSVFLGRSSDLGDSWETSVVRDARGKQGPETEVNIPVSSVAVDIRSGDQDVVYVTWNQARHLAQPPVGDRAMVAVSTDGGRTFGEPVSVLGPDIEATVGAAVESAGEQNLAVAADGTVFMTLLVELAPPERYMLVVSRSTDRGRTWSTNPVGAPDQYVKDFFRGSAMQWSPAGGEAGTIHLVYEDRFQGPWGDRDILYRRSTDGGRSFTAPHRVNDDDPSLRRVQGSPNLAVAPSGRVDVVWYDFRHDTGEFANDVYYAHSGDNGSTWSQNHRISDKSINRRIGVWSNGFDQRQAPGIASSDSLTTFAWDDTRNGDVVTQTQDIFSAVAQFEAVGTPASNAWRYALGAAGGVLVVASCCSCGPARAAAARAAAVERNRWRGYPLRFRLGRSVLTWWDASDHRQGRPAGHPQATA